ncbi:hypothetical protein ANTRET_LOCUS10786, partial [Anthophora retusa]
MYKTVRKGDASLQYTILPQTDQQFSSSGFPQPSDKPRPRIIKYTMGTLMVLIIMSCVATPFLMNQNDQSLFASTVLAMRRIGHNTIARNSSRSQGKDIDVNKSKSRLLITTTVSSTEVYRKQDIEDEMTTVSELQKVDEQETEDLTTMGIIQIGQSFNRLYSSISNSSVNGKLHLTSLSSWFLCFYEFQMPDTFLHFATTGMQHLQTATETTTNVRQTSTSTSYQTTSPTSVTNLKTLTSTSSEVTKITSSAPTWKAKMPRVTLKLRENETIPQMYMKAGIASYKKGNITTSVLAHGLSLEGLIFKTPEGTIKPWPRKWFFTDPSSDFQWKVQSPEQVSEFGQISIVMYVVLIGLAVLAVITIMLFYIQRKTTKRQRQSVEEPEVEGHEEDKSTLLGGESHETEEKE